MRTICKKVAGRFGVTPQEIWSRSLRRAVLQTRAVVSRLAVHRYGLTLSATGRHLGVSKQSIARALLRTDDPPVREHCSDDDLID